MFKILWNFEIQKDRPIQARRPDQVSINKKKEANHRVKMKESKKIEK